MAWLGPLKWKVMCTLCLPSIKGHDAHIVVALGSRIQPPGKPTIFSGRHRLRCVLELERYFGRRYFVPKLDDFHEHLGMCGERSVCEELDESCGGCQGAVRVRGACTGSAWIVRSDARMDLAPQSSTMESLWILGNMLSCKRPCFRRSSRGTLGL